MPTPPDDPHADKPDRWERDDRAWREKWSEKDPDDEGYAAPPPGAYTPGGSSPDEVRDAYNEGMRGAGPYLGLGVQIGGSMAFFVGAGIVVDRWLGTSPWGVVAGAVLGMVGIVFLVLRVAGESGAKK